MLLPTGLATVRGSTFVVATLLHGTIEDIVLRDEDHVEQQTDVGQAKLHRITSQATPVGLKRAIYKELNHAEQATAKVEQLLRD